MQRVATVMARSTLMPETLYMTGDKNNREMLPYEQILSNCFLVVNQAVRWGLDPFAVAQCVSVVHGKLCYEGKLVSAVMQAKMGINLNHHITGEGESMRIYLSDKPFTDDIVPLLKPGYRRNDMRIFDGSVADWKTTAAGTPWTPKNFPRMLIYRGSRDWCRIYEPALMLGVYTPDEMVDMENSSRFRAAKNVTPSFDPLSDEPAAMQKLPAPEESGQEATEQPGDEREQVPCADAPDEADKPSSGEDVADPETGEIQDTPDTDAESSSPASEQPGEVASSSQTSPGAPATFLVRFARDVFTMAMDQDATGSTFGAVLKRWHPEIEKLDPDDKAKAEQIGASAKRLFNDAALYDGIVEFYCEMLGCEPHDLMEGQDA